MKISIIMIHLTQQFYFIYKLLTWPNNSYKHLGHILCQQQSTGIDDFDIDF